MPKEKEWEDACDRLTVLENQLATVDTSLQPESKDEDDEPPALAD